MLQMLGSHFSLWWLTLSCQQSGLRERSPQAAVGMWLPFLCRDAQVGKDKCPTGFPKTSFQGDFLTWERSELPCLSWFPLLFLFQLRDLAPGYLGLVPESISHTHAVSCER